MKTNDERSRIYGEELTEYGSAWETLKQRYDSRKKKHPLLWAGVGLAVAGGLAFLFLSKIKHGKNGNGKS